MTTIFEEFGLSQQDVTKWQTEKNLGHLSERALCQLYARVVNGKTFKPPNPIYTIKAMWDKIEKISSGQEEKPKNNKLWLGFKDVDILVKINDIPYTGCPECFKSKKTIKKSHCTDHGPEPVELVEHHITEYVISDGESEFTMKLFASMSAKYPEHMMVGGQAWVEGNIDLTQDPIALSVGNFRTFKAGTLLGKGSFVEDEEEVTVDRSDVVIEGFDDDEVEETTLFEDKEAFNPFEEKESVKTETSLIEPAVKELREYMQEMLSTYAKESSTPKSSVLRSMQTWIQDHYSEITFTDESLWGVIEGLYKDEDDDRLRYSGE